jgi:hypothetical protein
MENTFDNEMEFDEVLITEDNTQDSSNGDGSQTSEVEEEIDDAAIATFKTLRDKGIILTEENAEIKTWGDLDTYIEEIPKMVMDNLVSAAPEETQKLIQFAFAKGNDLTKEDLKDFIQMYLEDSNVAEVNTIEDARKVLEKAYSEQGMRKSVINAALDALEDDGEDVILDEAKKYSKTNKADKAIEDVKAQNVQRENEQKQYFNTFAEEVKNQTFNDKRKQIIQEELTKGVANQKLEAVIANPKSIVQLVNFLTYYDDKTGNFDFKDFVNQSFSKDAEKLKNNIVKDNFSSVKNTGAQNITNKRTKVSLEDYEPLD